MKIKAAVLHQMGMERPYHQSKPLVIEEVELEKPRRGEILVKVHAAGLCHSDLSVIDGNRPRQVPMVLGHEAAGEVVEGNADSVAEVVDSWSFARDTRSRDPNWKLVQTQSEG